MFIHIQLLFGQGIHFHKYVIFGRSIDALF